MLCNLLQNSYNIVHHTLSVLLHYLGKLEVHILWKLHCALKTCFILLALTRWNLNRLSQFFHCWSHSKHLFMATNWENFFSLRAVQFTFSSAVSFCARRLLKHFSCRSFHMMPTTDDLGMPVFRDISRTVLWVRRWSSWLRTISFTWSMFSSVRAWQFPVCRCPDVCPLCSCPWTSWTTC